MKQGRFAHIWEDESALEYIQLSVEEQWKYWEEMDKTNRIILPWTTPYVQHD
jgi:hypothetical protein